MMNYNLILSIKNNINNVVIIAYLLCFFCTDCLNADFFFGRPDLKKIEERACIAASKNVDKQARVCKHKGFIYYINRICESFRCLIFPRNAWIWPNQFWAKT